MSERRNKIRGKHRQRVQASASGGFNRSAAARRRRIERSRELPKGEVVRRRDSDDDIGWSGGSERPEQGREDLAAVGVAGWQRTIAFGLRLVEFSLQAGGAEMAVTGDALVAGILVIVSLCGLSVRGMDAKGERDSCDQGQHSGGSPPPLGYAQSQSHLHPSI
ncbi:hypothetical protein [Pelagibius sp. 7325]|uniref:hypothetical protein n=1 Tax=Pelagibius sp. 7325 TaxID=3131994 RepID=UPI0030EDFED8